ncbi:MAG: hypothetical protein E7460_07305 [Ruminococcaceae bacterium]|nr:hypothetical protein [Oscillospiraceae bacterium]
MYFPVILSLAGGLACLLLGIGFMCGLLYTIKLSDHVPEENKAPFYRAQGLCFVLLALALFTFGGFTFAARRLDNQIYTYAGLGVALIPFAINLIISRRSKARYEVFPPDNTEESRSE